MPEPRAPDAADRIVATIHDLPTLPNVVFKINRQVADARTSAADINETLAADPVLSAKVLKLVNSPYYGFPRRITSVAYAVVILGFSAIRNLALSAFMFDAFRQGDKPRLDLHELWRHQVATAFIAGTLMRRRAPKLADDAFMAGLLHDLGKAIMEQFRKDDLHRVAGLVDRDDVLFLAAERAAGLAYDHAALGGALLDRWNLPESVVEAVRRHHAPDEAASEAGRRLAQVVNVADVLARMFGVGSGGDRRLPAVDGPAWRAEALAGDELDDLLRRLAGDLEQVDPFFA